MHIYIKKDPYMFSFHNIKGYLKFDRLYIHTTKSLITFPDSCERKEKSRFHAKLYYVRE